ncbi:MAG: hypothetical protein C4K60_08225 [Ideonella sp. MAG2]|nr:MAG: hypothetical protein C4K60_08225 [Ideonella sp. MAG2]
MAIAAAERAAQQEGEPFAKEFGLVDPAYAVATELAARLGQSAGVTAQRLSTPEDARGQDLSVPSRYVLEARTDRWAAQYLALDKGRYGTQLALTVLLSDSQTGSTLATGQCQRFDAEADRIEGYDAMVADQAARLHRAMDKHRQACITEIWNQLAQGLPQNMAAKAAAPEPVTTGLAATSAAAVVEPLASPVPVEPSEPQERAGSLSEVSAVPLPAAPSPIAPVAEVPRPSPPADAVAATPLVKVDQPAAAAITPSASVKVPPVPEAMTPLPRSLGAVPKPPAPVAASERGPMIVLPPSTAADRVLENSQVAHRYHIYLSRPNPKAFAVSENGGWWMAWGDALGAKHTVSQRALRGCEERSNSACVLFAVDDRFVFGMSQKGSQ